MALHFDAETDGLYDKVTKVHCLIIYDDQTDKTYICDPQNLDIEVGVRMLLNADVICGHNIIDYDIPVLEKLYSWAKFTKEYGVNYLDTLVLSRVTYPDIKSSDFTRLPFTKCSLQGCFS